MSEINTIVVGVDGSAGAEAALRWAMAEAARHGASVRAVRATQLPYAGYPFGAVAISPELEPYLASAREGLATRVDGIVAEFAGTPPTIEQVVELGGAAEVLLAEAEKADLIVVGARDEAGLIAKVLGTVTDQVVHHAACPVAVISGDARPGSATSPVLVGVDGSEHADPAVRFAVELAEARGTRVLALMAWTYMGEHPDPQGHGKVPFSPDYHQEQAEQALDAALRRAVGDTAAGRIDRLVVVDFADDALLAAAEDHNAAMIVVGARGLGGFKGLLVGSVSRKVLSGSHRPVVVVKS